MKNQLVLKPKSVLIRKASYTKMALQVYYTENDVIHFGLASVLHRKRCYTLLSLLLSYIQKDVIQEDRPKSM